MMTSKPLSLASRAYLENEEFQEAFCEGCSAIRNEECGATCPVDFDASDTDCVRRLQYVVIEEYLRAVDKVWMEISDERD